MGQKNTNLTKATTELNTSVTKKAAAGFAKKLEGEKIIRLFVDGPPGMGHQASSVRVLQALTTTADAPFFGYNYQGTVEIYYQVRNDGEDTLAKLYQLLPELDNKLQGKVNNATVNLILYDSAKTPALAANFGFTGGADNYPDEDVSPNFATALNVGYFLRLQPYYWQSPHQIQLKGQIKDNWVNFIDLKHEGFGESFLFRAYYQSPPTLSEGLWTKYCSVAGIPGNRAKILKKIIELVNAGTYDLQFVYGVRSASCPMSPNRDRVADLLVTTISSVLTWQWKDDAVWSRSKSTIIVNLDNFIFQDAAYPSIAYILDVLNGGKVQVENIDGDLRAQKSRAGYLKDHLKAPARVRCQNGGTLEQFQAYIPWLNGSTDRVLFLQLGSVPPPLFDYVYAQSTLPRIFEGMGTANLALNLGQWYFHVARPDIYSCLYPTTIVGYNDAEEPKKFKDAANLINKALNFTGTGWPKVMWDGDEGDEKKMAPYGIGMFMQRFYDETNEDPLKKYLARVKAFYADMSNCKLRMAINYLNYMLDTKDYLPSLQINSNLTDNILSLEELYEVLEQEIQSTGKVLLMPGVLEKLDDIGTYYSDLLAVLNTQLIIDPASLERNTGGDLQWIKLSGLTTAPLGPTDSISQTNALLEFVMSQGKIQLKGTYTEDAEYALQNVPWVVVKNPFNQWITTSGLPLAGQVGAMLPSLNLQLSYSFPAYDGLWLLSGNFVDPVGLDSLFQIMGGVNLLQGLQGPFKILTAFKATQLQFLYDSNNTRLQSISAAAETVESVELLPNLLLNSIKVNFTVVSPIDVVNRTIQANVVGQFKIGNRADSGIIQIGASFPGLALNGELISGNIKLEDLLSIFLPNTPLELPAVPTITAFLFSYNTDGSGYSVSCQFNISWPIIINQVTIFNINEVNFSVSRLENTQGFISGTIIILPDDPNVNLGLTLSATYLGSNLGWVFKGEQVSGLLSISGLIKEYIGWDITTDIDVNGLAVSISTKTNFWEFSAKTAKDIFIDFLDLSFSFNALIGYGQKDVSSPAGKYGTISTDVEWFGIDFTLFYNFDPTYSAYGIKWGGLEGKVEEVIIKGVKHQIATLSFTESVTVGSLVETFVSWATGSKFGLSSPWDILNDIPLNGLQLIYDFTDKSVSFNYSIGPIDLVFATINAIKVSYNNNDPDPDNNGVMVTLDITSSFGDVPSWNAAKPETTPAPPGQGNKYLDLRLLAMGQHVTLPCFATANTVQEAIACMETMPAPVAGQVPTNIVFDPNSSWLIGMDFGVLRITDDSKNSNTAPTLLTDTASNDYFLTLQIIFNDPNLYALRIALAGEPAKIFKGLDFQIMYKKVSDTVGVYMAEITLPDAMRQIKMGEFNITLPVFAIQIFTNGDFQVDIGFPWNQDFSRSLSFQAWIITPVGPIPVMGSLGFYFGKLSSATTSKVPQTTTGTFNPVLVFGFGIQFGLGFSFSAGILSAGFSLTAIAILEGIIAKWNPYKLPALPENASQVETSYYFWFRGTVGIIGKLYGSIDFAIIKASLNVDIRIIAQITFESYAPILLSLTASVDVSLTVTINLGIFKIHISFSFSARISQSVTIAAIGGTAPWGGGSPAVAGIPARRLAYAYKTSYILSVQAIQPVWSNLIKADTPVPLNGYLGLGLTMAGDTAINLTDQLACYVSLLFIQSVASPQDDKTSCIKRAFENKSIQDTDIAFEKLCKMIFRWAIASIQSTSVTKDQVEALTITDDQLKQLLDYLTDKSNPVPITSSEVATFMKQQFQFVVTAQQNAGEDNATYFPVPDDMTFAVPAYGTSYPALSYSYGSYNSLSSAYITTLASYFDELAVIMQQEAQSVNVKFAVDGNTSMSSFVFGDYFVLICRQMIQAARESLKDFKYFLNPGDTFSKIVTWVQQNGQPAYSTVELFNDNSDTLLNSTAGNKFAIENSTYIIQSADTFDAISKQGNYANGFTSVALALLNSETKNILQAGIKVQYSDSNKTVTLPGQSLTDVAAALGVSVTDLINNAGISTLSNLLLPVATIIIPPFNYTVVTNDTIKIIASKFGLTPAALAEPTVNINIADPFDATIISIDIVALEQFNVGKIMQEIQATQGLQHLSGMTSRYYMAGLRLPTDGITPNYAGMWVSQKGSNLILPKAAGLYALTGQQFPLPILESTNFNITFSTTSGWMIFAGANPAQVTIPIIPGQQNALQIQAVTTFASNNRLDVGTTFLGIGGTFNSDFTTYPFTSEISWSSASNIPMPYGGQVPGVPSLKLWQLPDTLLQLPDSSRAVNPRMQMLVGQYNSATGSMVNSNINYYGYATNLEFNIKRIPAVSNSPATLTTYEISGADGTNADLLEKIVAGIGSNDTLIENIILAFSVNTNGSTPKGIQTDDPQFLTVGIAQVNLSTETRPDQLSFNWLIEEGATAGLGLLNKPSEFINLLWEASITRAGGFYLYYYNAESAAGLPDNIFNDKNEATLHLLVLYTAPADASLKNTITAYTNALITAEYIDTASAVLFAQANPNTVSITTNSTQALSQLAYNYYENVSDIAIDNQLLPLRAGISLAITEGTFEVGPQGSTPGGDIDNIASYFGTTVTAIKNANPARQDWPNPLPLFTSMLLPQLNLVVGTSPGANTLAAVSCYYGQNLSSLAGFNQDVTGIFADGESIAIAGGPKTKSSTVPAGVAAMEATRPIPSPVPDNPADPNYGKYFLQNTYSLLSYQLVENEFFTGSNIGLPAGPTTTPADTGNDKIRAPKTALAGDSWVYKQSIPYSRFSKQNFVASANLPDPKDSPYKGLGDLLKVNFSWLDYYGNELVTTLSTPLSTDGSAVLNQPPALTGYTDALTGISQWPSVSSSWLVDTNSVSNAAEVQLQLNFDNSTYQGLCAVVVQSATVIIASYTLALEPTSSTNLANYLIQQQTSPGSQTYRTLIISAIVLNSDLKSVTITVDRVDANEDQQITMNIGSILSDTSKPITFSGVAKFFYPADPTRTVTPVTDSAIRDLAVYKQLWYQLTDINGIQLSVNTSLLQGVNIFSTAQVTDLIQTWIASIYYFIADRTNAGLSVPAPAQLHTLAFPVNFADVNASQIFKLDLNFIIERTGGAVAGDFETTGGIKQVSSVIPAYSSQQTGSTTYTFDTFATSFEKAMIIPGAVAYYAASGVDRTENTSSSGGKEIWAARVELAKTSGIGYQVNNPKAPVIFAPRPISNILEFRTNIPIYDFNATTGIDFNKVSRTLDFSGIDMDIWGKVFFTAIDHILSPEFTAAIQIIDKQQNSAYYADIIKNKSALADIVKKWMIPAFNNVQADAGVVQELFKQNLLVQLNNAYSTTAAVQFNASVQAEKPTGIAPRLLGAINISFACIGAVMNTDDNTQLDLFFNSEPNQTVAETPASYQVSDGLIIKSAVLDPSDSGKVTLQLNEKAVVNVTQASIVAPAFADILGNPITPPLTFTVQAQIDAGNYTNAISITSAKLDLAPATDATLAFLLSSPQVVRDVAGSVVPYVDLNLNYSGNTIEHQIEQLFTNNPYLASSWLSFLTKAGNNALTTALGNFKVPMFLRNFPSPPTMILQSGAGSDDQTKINFSTLLNWDYTICYSEPFHFPQDVLSFTVNFNVMDDTFKPLFGIEDAFAELAEFITVFPAVNQALTDSVASIDATTDPSKFTPAIVALSSFNGMVDRIVKAATPLNFAMLPKVKSRISNAALPYNFNLSEGKTIINTVEALLIIISGDLPDGIKEITIMLDDCNTINYAPYKFYFTHPDGSIVTAAYGQQQPNRKIILKKMNILARQDAETIVELKRNVELVPGNKSADAFIYTTGQVGFPNNYHPSIINDEQIEISTINASTGQNNTTTLEQQLINLFTALLGENTQPILSFQMNCSYNYAIGTGVSDIALPVFMQPLISVQVLPGDSILTDANETLKQMIDNWVGAIKLWYKNYQPNSNNAVFDFDLTVFSSLTLNPMILIKLTDLTLEIRYITDLNN